MNRHITHDTRTKHKKSNRLRKNIAMHPSVLVAFIAAIAVAVWAILFQWFSIGF